MKYLLITILSIAMAAGSMAQNVEATPKPTDPMKAALAEMLEGVTKTAGQAKDFLVAEIPDVIRQLLMWKMAEHLFYTLVPWVLVFVSWRFWLRFRKSAEWRYGAPENGSAILMIVSGSIGGVMTIISTICLFDNLEWLQILIAPKVYLLEYARDLVK